MVGSGQVKTASSDDCLLKPLWLRYRFKTAEDIMKDFFEEGGSEISTKIVYSKISEARIVHSMTCQKQILDNKNPSKMDQIT